MRVVLTKAWSERPRYATLSHCWGALEFETLRSSNLDEMLNCVPKKSLTKTFVDAIEIARAVGLEYLWIDSWCIIQDDHGDWETEAARMASVYGGSSLNIAASSAKDGREGCFPRPTYHSLGFPAEIRINGQREVHHFVPWRFYNRMVLESTLLSRAWVLQEKLLAPRTLHCGEQGMFWECWEAMASDAFPNGFDGTGAQTWFFECSTTLRPTTWDSTSWLSLVTRYSRCDLTYPGDKLVALAGIARSIGDRTHDQYFAGLWGKFFEAELCWKVLGPRPKPLYRAPSWSWAAVDGDIGFDYQYYYPNITVWSGRYFEVIDVTVSNKGTDPYGPVAHGALTLDSEWIRRGTISRPQSAAIPEGLESNRGPVTLYLDLGHEESLFPFCPD